jgi:hypothetical protein
MFLSLSAYVLVFPYSLLHLDLFYSYFCFVCSFYLVPFVLLFLLLFCFSFCFRCLGLGAALKHRGWDGTGGGQTGLRPTVSFLAHLVLGTSRGGPGYAGLGLDKLAWSSLSMSRLGSRLYG